MRGQKKERGDSPYFLFSSESFNMPLSRAKTFARPKKTPALQATCIGVFCSLHYTWGKLKTTKLSSLDSYRILTLNFRIKKKSKQNKPNRWPVTGIRGVSRGRVQGVRTPPLEITCGFLIQLVFCKKKTMWFIGVEVEKRWVHPLLKIILDPPLGINHRFPQFYFFQVLEIWKN